MKHSDDETIAVKNREYAKTKSKSFSKNVKLLW